MIKNKIESIGEKIDWDVFTDNLYDKLWQFSHHYIDQSTLSLVREIYRSVEGGIDDGTIDHSHLQFIGPWLFFDSDYPIQVKDGNVARYNTLCEAYIASDKSLSALEKDFIQQALLSPFCFYRVIQRTNHRTIRLENMLTGRLAEISDNCLFDVTRKGDILFAKIIELNSSFVVASIAPEVFDKSHQKTVIEFKQGLLEHFEDINDQLLSLYKNDLLLLFEDLLFGTEEFDDAVY